MTVDEWTDARSLFGAARYARRDNERISSAIDRLRAREGLRAASLTPTGRGSCGIADANAATDARMAYEEDVAPRVADNDATISQARAVLLGLAAILGQGEADVLRWRYVEALSWDATSLMCSRSIRSCQDHANAALDFVDSNGIGATARGIDTVGNG